MTGTNTSFHSLCGWKPCAWLGDWCTHGGGCDQNHHLSMNIKVRLAHYVPHSQQTQLLLGKALPGVPSCPPAFIIGGYLFCVNNSLQSNHDSLSNSHIPLTMGDAHSLCKSIAFNKQNWQSYLLHTEIFGHIYLSYAEKILFDLTLFSYKYICWTCMPWKPATYDWPHPDMTLDVART